MFYNFRQQNQRSCKVVEKYAQKSKVDSLFLLSTPDITPYPAKFSELLASGHATSKC